MKWRVLLTVALLVAVAQVGGGLAATQAVRPPVSPFGSLLALPLDALVQHVAAPQGIDIVAQATPRATRTVVRRTPTPSQAAPVDLSGAVLTLSDLPRGFRALPLEPLNLTTGTEFIENLEIAGSFAFLDAAAIELVYGLTVLLENAAEMAVFTDALADPGAFADGLTALLEAEDVQDVDIFFPPDVGSDAVAVSFSAVFEGLDVRVTAFAFLRGTVGAIVITMHLPEEDARYPAEQGAAVLDGRIIEALGGVPTPRAVTLTPRVGVRTLTPTRTPRSLSRRTPEATLTGTPFFDVHTLTPTATRRSLHRTPDAVMTGTPRVTSGTPTVTRTARPFVRRTPTPGTSP